MADLQGFPVYNGMYMSVDERYLWVAGTAATCLLIFVSSWFLSLHGPSATIRRHFRGLTFKQKADWCSRFPSVLHAVIVLPILVRELQQLTFDENFQTSDNLYYLERNMVLSCGYFLYDLTLIISTRMELWPLYVFHHCAALWPLISVLFNGCSNYAYFGAGYFLVEATIVPLQLIQWMEALGARPDHWIVNIAHHVCFWAWCISRFFFPPWITYNGIFVVMPRDDSVGFWQCKVPVGNGGMCIWIFCWLVFFAHILPGYYRRVIGRKPELEDPRKME